MAPSPTSSPSTRRTGALATTKTPSTPSDPAEGFLAGIRKILDQLGATGDDIRSVSHGTTVATNQLLEGKVEQLGFVTTEGYEFVLEIARQSVPDGYGNSYFWVKPDRIVPAHLVKTVGGRLDHHGAELRPFDEQRAVEVARWFRDRGIDTLGVCFLHSYANPEHELRMRDVLAARAPGRRRVDLVRGAARVPRVRALDDHPGRRGGEAAGLALRPLDRRPVARHARARRARSR